MVAHGNTEPVSPASVQRVLRDMEFERKRTNHEKLTFWVVIWTLVSFKLGTIAMILWYAHNSAEANAYIVSTSWYWLLVPAVASSGFFAYRWRLHKTKRRLKTLQQREHLENYWADHHEHHELTAGEKAALAGLVGRREDSEDVS